MVIVSSSAGQCDSSVVRGVVLGMDCDVGEDVLLVGIVMDSRVSVIVGGVGFVVVGEGVCVGVRGWLGGNFMFFSWV